MLFEKPLVPYAFRLKDLFILGLSFQPGECSPCKSCIELWLTRKKQEYHEVAVSLVPHYEVLLRTLRSENSPHVLFEVSENGLHKKIETIIFAHPFCHCQTQASVSFPQQSQQFNTLLSPIESIKSARYGTEMGNLWTAKACGHSFQGVDSKIEAFGIGKERDEAKKYAFLNWLKKWVERDKFRFLFLENSGFESDRPSASAFTKSFFGVGESQEKAELNAYLEFAKLRTFHRFTRNFKNPIMIVDTEPYFRQQVPSFIYKQFDMFLLFYPNSTPSWVFGLVMFSRVAPSENPIFLLHSGVNVEKTLCELLARTLEVAKPLDSYQPSVLDAIYRNKKITPLNHWWMAWLYRSTKLGLKEVMSLESYPEDIKLWKNYFNDGQEPLRLSLLQDSKVPSTIGSLVRLEAALEASANSNVMGMGSLSIFQKVLHT